MTSYQSILKKLAPLNIYQISDDSNIRAELMSYCEALDVHRENMDKVYRECFISSAEDFGLTLRERVIGDENTDCSTEKRREMLIFRKSLGDNDFTIPGFKKIMNSLGVESYRLDESPNTNSIAVTVSGDFDQKKKAWLDNQIRLIMPAHLVCTVYFSGISWHEFEIVPMSFSYLDGLDRTWKQLDNVIS